MLARKDLYNSEFLSVRHVACRSAQQGTSDLEYSDPHTLVMPLRGVFMEHFSPRTRILAEPSVALLFRAGHPHKVSHPAGTEDDCLVLEFSSFDFEEIQRRAIPKDNLPVMGTLCMLSPAAMTWRNLLWSRLERKLAGALETEESAIALLSSVLHGANPEQERNSSGSVRKGSRILKQIEVVKVVLLTRPESKWSLTALAKHVEMSPFHLTRMFRRKVGVSLHQYLCAHVLPKRSISFWKRIWTLLKLHSILVFPVTVTSPRSSARWSDSLRRNFASTRPSAKLSKRARF